MDFATAEALIAGVLEKLPPNVPTYFLPGKSPAHFESSLIFVGRADPPYRLVMPRSMLSMGWGGPNKDERNRFC
jgi:hypothetical protein